MNNIDHVAIGTDTLEKGVDAMQASLGEMLTQGSKHDLMSTHNKVMQAGNESFFELIAQDLDAPKPTRTRWFTLDDQNTLQRLAERPRALCWVVNTDDLDALVATSPIDLGEVVTFTRGDRSWRLTVPADGHLPEAGLIPAFIEWSPGPHPSTGQQDLGVILRSVNLSHPDPENLNDQLTQLQVDSLAIVSKGEIGLSFTFDTPNGMVTLD